MKKLISVLMVAVAMVMLVGCNQADEYECMVANELEEATGLEWEIYEMEIIAGKECQANSFFQPDTGMEVYVFKYSETYAEIQIYYGNEQDEELFDVVADTLEGIFNVDIVKYDGVF